MALYQVRTTSKKNNVQMTPDGRMVGEKEWRRMNLEWERRRRDAKEEEDRRRRTEEEDRKRRYLRIFFKGTVSVISSDLPPKHVRHFSKLHLPKIIRH